MPPWSVPIDMQMRLSVAEGMKPNLNDARRQNGRLRQQIAKLERHNRHMMLVLSRLHAAHVQALDAQQGAASSEEHQAVTIDFTALLASILEEERRHAMRRDEDERRGGRGSAADAEVEEDGEAEEAELHTFLLPLHEQPPGAQAPLLFSPVASERPESRSELVARQKSALNLLYNPPSSRPYSPSAQRHKPRSEERVAVKPTHRKAPSRPASAASVSGTGAAGGGAAAARGVLQEQVVSLQRQVEMLQAKLARAEQQQQQPRQPQPQHTTNDSASDDAEAGTIAYMRAELDAARAAATKSDARAREAIAQLQAEKQISEGMVLDGRRKLERQGTEHAKALEAAREQALAQAGDAAAQETQAAVAAAVAEVRAAALTEARQEAFGAVAAAVKQAREEALETARAEVRAAATSVPPPPQPLVLMPASPRSTESDSVDEIERLRALVAELQGEVDVLQRQKEERADTLEEIESRLDTLGAIHTEALQQATALPE